MDLKKHISKIEKWFYENKSVLNLKMLKNTKKFKIKIKLFRSKFKKVKKFHNGAEVIYNLQNKDYFIISSPTK